MTLDRIDTTGNYEPGNLKWSSWHEQRLNQKRMRDPMIGITKLPSGHFHVRALNINGARVSLGTFPSFDIARAVRITSEHMLGIR